MKFMVDDYVKVIEETSSCFGLIGQVKRQYPIDKPGFLNCYRVDFDNKVTANTKVEDMKSWMFCENELENE